MGDVLAVCPAVTPLLDLCNEDALLCSFSGILSFVLCFLSLFFLAFMCVLDLHVFCVCWLFLVNQGCPRFFLAFC